MLVAHKRSQFYMTAKLNHISIGHLFSARAHAAHEKTRQLWLCMVKACTGTLDTDGSCVSSDTDKYFSGPLLHPPPNMKMVDDIGGKWNHLCSNYLWAIVMVKVLSSGLMASCVRIAPHGGPWSCSPNAISPGHLCPPRPSSPRVISARVEPSIPATLSPNSVD